LDPCEPMSRILVADDEPRIVSFVSRALAADGYMVDSAHDGRRALEMMMGETYDLTVLDLRLPVLHGVAVLKAALARNPEQRVLILSALADVESKVGCLELGALDYMTKPFALEELLARIRIRLRERPAEERERLVRSGDVSLDLVRREADVGHGPVALSTREFLLLRHLMRRAPRICAREELLSGVWGYSFDPGTNVVDVYVGRLRSKLGSHVVETVRNVGYACSPA